MESTTRNWKGVLSLGLMVLGCTLLLEPGASAQQASGIAGLVKDSSGAVLPGVTVEAASPALIEKVRTAVTDGEGRYSIVDLRPGPYSVTFTLTGFNTIKRSGIDLTSGFTATVNAELPVGTLTETVTVSGAAPLVDATSAKQQNVVSREMLDVLPTSQQSMATLANVTPGMIGNPDVGGTAGTYSQQAQVGGFHGKTNSNRINFDGMRISNMCGVSSISYIVNGAMVEEMVVETGGFTAESNSSSVLMNAIPKEGGNTFKGSIYGMFTNNSLQSSNLTDNLKARGLTTGFDTDKMYHFDATFGGPLIKDKIWFYTGHRWTGNRNQVGGIFWNATQHQPIYTADLKRPMTQQEDLRSNSGRITYQVSAKNKINAFVDVQDNKMPRYRRSTGFNSPEAVAAWHFLPPAGLYQGTWSSPVTSKLLLEAGVSAMLQPWPNTPQEGMLPTDISINDNSTGFTFGAAGGAQPYGDNRHTDRFAERFAVSYVTGSHNFKFGIQDEQGHYIQEARHSGALPVSYTYNCAAGFNACVPQSVTLWATPYTERDPVNHDMGIYAQDRWTVGRLTASYGLRFDWLKVSAEASQTAATPFLPARSFARIDGAQNYKDFSPRLGVSYDLFGNGRTAVKGTFGRYVVGNNGALTRALNPLQSTVNSTNRAWTDNKFGAGDPRTNNYIPDCDLTNPAANGECAVYSNAKFGQLVTNQRYSDELMKGWGNRDYLWDVSAEVQHQVNDKVSLNGGYYRNWYRNFAVTDNTLVTPADYSPYCITAPVDARLPNGGGYQVCGLYDINANRFGQVDNNNVIDKSLGFKQQRVSDFLGVGFNARIGKVRIGGGVDTGRVITDNCFTIDSPQQLLYCRQVQPFQANTQLKLNGSYQLPYSLVISAVLQNVSGPAITADYAAPTAIIKPSLGRDLSGGTKTATVPLIKPFTMFEDRRNQVDVRFSKSMALTPKVRLRANLDVYNALNSSAILGITTAFGPAWRRPTSGAATNSAVLDARLVQFSGDLSF